MHPLLQRIVINGLLAAVFLALIGAVLGQIGAMFVPRSDYVGTEQPGPNPDEELIQAIQYRTPITLAVWGFAFVAVGEVILYFWRGRTPPTPTTPTGQPQNTEQMLQELLAKAEAEEKARSEALSAGSRHRDLGGESIELKGGLPDLGGGHKGKESEERSSSPPQPPKQD